jgi:hypothetical protein
LKTWDPASAGDRMQLRTHVAALARTHGVASTYHVRHDGPTGVGKRRMQDAAHIAGLLNADVAGAERRGYLRWRALLSIVEVAPRAEVGRWLPEGSGSGRRIRRPRRRRPDPVGRTPAGIYHGHRYTAGCEAHPENVPGRLRESRARQGLGASGPAAHVRLAAVRRWHGDREDRTACWPRQQPCHRDRVPGKSSGRSCRRALR